MPPINEARTAPPVATDSALATSGVGMSELETFIAVAELGSFSLASKRLHLSQPAVTARVQKLENALGIRLLHRTTRSVEVTEAGRRLADRAQEALRGLRELIAEFSQQNTEARMRVVVAATPMLAAMLLPGVLGRYSTRYPDVDVAVLDMRHSLALQALERGEADIGVMALDDPQPKLRFTPLMQEPLVLVLPMGHPLANEAAVSLRQLAPWPVMVLEKYTALLAQLAKEYERQNLQFRPAATAANLTTLLGMLDAGRGVVLLPLGMAQHNASRPRVVVPLADCDLHRNYGILVPRTSELSSAARSFVDFLRADTAQSGASIGAGAKGIDLPD